MGELFHAKLGAGQIGIQRKVQSPASDRIRAKRFNVGVEKGQRSIAANPSQPIAGLGEEAEVECFRNDNFNCSMKESCDEFIHFTDNVVTF